MVADDERRRVAAALREKAGRCLFAGDYIEEILWDDAYSGFSIDEAAKTYNRLADLIDPDATGDMTKSQSISLSASLCDRGELLALADEMQGYADGAASGDGYPNVNAGNLWAYADRIREACGEAVDG